MCIKRALISVTDKSELYELAIFLITHDIEIISTGGTRQYLTELGIESTDVAEYTGFPEMMDGRLKTLHPLIHGGILGRRGIDDDVMDEYGIAPIDLVVVNLYDFEKASKDRALTRIDSAIEKIDIGGPTMLRSAAKNFQDVVVLCDVDDYSDFMIRYEEDKDISFSHRMEYAQKVFVHTSHYDKLIADYLFVVNPRHIA